jgi:hypothetical protein
MALLFGRLARAREGSSAHEKEKEALRRLRDRLIAEGRLPAPKPKQGGAPSVDVLAEISANSLPLGSAVSEERYAEPTHHIITVAAPDPSKGIPELPSTSKVAAEICSTPTIESVLSTMHSTQAHTCLA